MKRGIYEFLVVETLKVINELVWVWIATELKYKTIIGIRTCYKRNILIAKQLIL